MPLPFEPRCEWLPISTIKKITDSFRVQYWPENTFPIDIEKILTKSLGIDIVPEPDLQIDAYLRKDYHIAVNQEKYMDTRYDSQMRFSLAHELGHFVLHKHIFDHLDFTTLEEYLAFYEEISKQDYNVFELQANEFAINLLVPREALECKLGEFRKDLISILERVINVLEEVDATILLNDNIETVNFQQCQILARQFGITTAHVRKIFQNNAMPWLIP
jgi:hypothetical protein